MKKLLWGNTSLSTSQKFDYLTMLTAIVSMSYVGYVAIKEVRRGRKS